jgi:hypothetical protein
MRHTVPPLGIIYSVRLGALFGVVYAAVLQWKTLGADVQTPTLLAIGCCVLLCVVTFPFERYCKRRFLRLALKCSACGGCLVFLRDDDTGARTLETGCCFHCANRVFNT